MKVSISLGDAPLRDVPRLAKLYENLGFDVLVFHETKHDPFLAMALAAEHTQRVALRSGVAIAFPRSPMTTAYTAWDLQQLSGGRLELGLGSQVRGHILKRYSTAWLPPAPRMREYVRSMRAVWDTWQTGAPLKFRGDYYSFSLMTPFFNPGPIEHPRIPVYISAVNTNMLRLAREMCEGLLLHPITTPRYVREVVLPELKAGSKRGGRSLEGFELAASGLLVVGETEEELEKQKEAVRLRIAFYASTPRYQRVMSVHGWQDVGEKLHKMSLKGLWKEMAKEVTDEMLEEFAVVATYDQLADKVMGRFGEYATTVDLSLPVRSSEQEKAVGEVVNRIHRQSG